MRDAETAALRAEVERLTQQVEQQKAYNVQAAQEHERLRAREARLLEYTDHKDGCAIYPVPHGCTCGYIALLADPASAVAES